MTTCTHNEMTERAGDQSHAWQCANCGHVYGPYDAGLEREELSEQLARWILAGYETTDRARVFYRRVLKLAKAVKRTFPHVMAVLREDATARIDEGEFDD